MPRVSAAFFLLFVIYSFEASCIHVAKTFKRRTSAVKSLHHSAYVFKNKKRYRSLFNTHAEKSGLDLKPIHAFAPKHDDSLFVVVNFDELKKKDPVRLFQHALLANNMEEISKYKQYADVWFPNGSTPLLDVIKNRKGYWQTMLVRFLLKNGANPLVPNLITLEEPISLCELIKSLEENSYRIDGYTPFYTHFEGQFDPVKEFTKLLMLRTPDDILVVFLKNFRSAKRFVCITTQDTEDDTVINEAAKKREVLQLHNAVAGSSALLSALIEPEKYDAAYLSNHANMLQQLNLIEATLDDEERLQNAIKAAKELAGPFVVNVANTVALLMQHDEIALFREDLERVYLLLSRNFSDKPMGVLPFLDLHDNADRILDSVIRRIRSRYTGSSQPTSNYI